MNEEEYKKIQFRCAKCKTRFDVWVSNSDFTAEAEEMIEKHFYDHCPVCKILGELKNKEIKH